MDHFASIVWRWIEHHTPDPWMVVLAALVLAWVDRGRTLRRVQRYDGWIKLSRSDRRFVRGRRSP